VLDSNPKRRAREVVAAAALLILGLLVLAPLPWLLGALDQVEWNNDFITGATVAVVLYLAIAVGYVVARWRSLWLVWGASALWVVIEQLRWEDNPQLSGIDDLSPDFLLPFTPLSILLPTIGVGLAKFRQSGFRRSPSIWGTSD
jgi:hypothetical protein